MLVFWGVLNIGQCYFYKNDLITWGYQELREGKELPQESLVVLRL